MTRFFLQVFSLVVAAQVMAQPSVREGPSAPNAEQTLRDTERKRISAERARLEAGFKAEETACYRKFFVNRCLNDIHDRRRAPLADLRRQEILLDEVERKQQAAEQLLRTEEKSALEQQQKAADQQLKAEQDALRRTERAEQRGLDQEKSAEQAAERKTTLENKQTGAKAKATDAQTRREKAAANVEDARVREEKAAKRRADLAQRLKEKGPPKGKPLPALPPLPASSPLPPSPPQPESTAPP